MSIKIVKSLYIIMLDNGLAVVDEFGSPYESSTAFEKFPAEKAVDAIQ